MTSPTPAARLGRLLVVLVVATIAGLVCGRAGFRLGEVVDPAQLEVQALQPSQPIVAESPNPESQGANEATAATLPGASNNPPLVESATLSAEALAGLASLAAGDPSGKPTAFTLLLAIVEPQAQPSLEDNAGAFALWRVDPERRSAVWLGLPADLQVMTPLGAPDRLDNVYALGEKLLPGGGARLLQQTLQENLKIALPRYFVITGEGLAQAVDHLGRLDVDVPYGIGGASEGSRAQATEWLTATASLRPGPQQWNGAILRGYLTARDRAGDADRLKRMRLVIDVAAQIAQRPEALARTVTLGLELAPRYQTNLQMSQLLGLVQVFKTYGPEQMTVRQVDSTMVISTPSATTGTPNPALLPRWDKIQPLLADWRESK